MPRIALSDHLARLLPALPDRARDRVLKAIQKLGHDRFDAGLRVKKMRTRPQVAVWEARVTGAGRLLFTYGHHRERSSNRSTLTAHCWTFVADHDDVARVVRRRKFEPPEAMSWLLGEELDALDWTTPLPPNPAANLTAIEEDFGGDERWEAYSALSGDYPSALTAPPEHLPWYLAEASAFDRWAADEDVPAELLLSDEQVDLLREPLPLFLNGPAGSGKTTVALYKLLALQEAHPDLRVAFVAHNPRLVSRAEEMYRALPTWPTKARAASFVTYDALLADLGGLPPTALSRCRSSHHEIARFLERHPLTAAERELFAGEIRAFVKGGLPPGQEPSRPEDVSDLMPVAAYLALPSRWTAVPDARRGDVHRLAGQYQASLEASGLFDEQDLASKTLRALLASAPRRYDVLVLDEVQDLTEKQLRVVLSAARSRRGTGLLLAGDPTQTLAASGFGWRVPKAVFAERGWDVPRPVTLTRSFRAGTPTLRLAHGLAELLKREGAPVVRLDPAHARASGGLPTRVRPSGDLDTALAVARPDVVCLAATAEEAAALRARWGHPFVWTVEEAKGLEADHVVLYELPDRLRHLPGGTSEAREAASQGNCRVLRLHYVAATRARESVTAVVTPDPRRSVWHEAAVRDVVVEADSFSAPWEGEVSDEEWRGRGHYYVDHEQWVAASACFRGAGDADWAEAARLVGEGAGAAETLDALHRSDAEVSRSCADFLLERFGDAPDGAPRVWLLRCAGRDGDADALQAALDEAEGRWAEAAAYHARTGERERAASLYERAGMEEEARALRPPPAVRKRRSTGSGRRTSQRGSTRPGDSSPLNRPGAQRSVPPSPFPGEPMLIAAARLEDYGVVRELLDSGISIGSRGRCDLTALHIVAWQRNQMLTRLLLEAGADPNALDEHMETPLYGAVHTQMAADPRFKKRPLLPIVDLLLEAGARPDAYSIMCVTPAKSTEDDAVRARLEEAEVAYYRRHPNARKVTHTWPRLSSTSKRLYQTSRKLAEAGGRHLPCEAARQVMIEAEHTASVTGAPPSASHHHATKHTIGDLIMYRSGIISHKDENYLLIDFGLHGTKQYDFDPFDEPENYHEGMAIGLVINDRGHSSLLPEGGS